MKSTCINIVRFLILSVPGCFEECLEGRFEECLELLSLHDTNMQDANKLDTDMHDTNMHEASKPVESQTCV